MAINEQAAWYPKWQEQQYGLQGITKRDDGENNFSWVGPNRGSGENSWQDIYGQGEGTEDLPNIQAPSQSWLNTEYNTLGAGPTWAKTGDQRQDLYSEARWLGQKKQYNQNWTPQDEIRLNNLTWYLAGTAPKKGGGLSAVGDAASNFMGSPAFPLMAGVVGGGLAYDAGLFGGAAAGSAGLADTGGIAALGETALGAETGAGEMFGLTGMEGASAAGGATGATKAAAGSALSRIIDGTAGTSDWAQVLGTGVATGLGVFGGLRSADKYDDLSAEMRADRLPYLQASQGWLQDPNSFMSGPGQAAMKGTLAGLSANFGNPIGSAAALGISNEAAMRNWLNAINSTGSLGLGGQGIQADLGAKSISEQGGIYPTIGRGISDIVNPQRQFKLSDFLA